MEELILDYESTSAKAVELSKDIDELMIYIMKKEHQIHDLQKEVKRLTEILKEYEN